ncbi:MAG: thioredoxin family protein [Ignavibacteria bacterium]|nr:thioredoxin family protein [Ignavibacteria bacterium]
MILLATLGSVTVQSGTKVSAKNTKRVVKVNDKSKVSGTLASNNTSIPGTRVSLSAGYNVGDQAANFTLKNIDGSMVSLSDFSSQKGVIVVFTCNHCPFAKMYESRLIDLHNKFSAKGFPVVAINPNDPVAEPDDSFENMQKRAKEKSFPFKYIFDETQATAKAYGATRTPHVYLLKNDGGKFTVSYIGAIDDNHSDAANVKEKYLDKAVTALIGNSKPSPETTKAIGCGIKWKK